MAKLPIYEVQSRPQGGQLSAQAMGANIGQAASDMGSTLVNIGDAMMRRQEVIERVQLLNSFDQSAVSDLEAVQADGSIVSKDTIDKYSSAMSQRMDQVLSQHKGRSGSRDELRAQLENQTGQYLKSAMGAQIKAQYKLIGDTADKIANKYASMATIAPDQMTNAFAGLESDLQKLDGSVSVDQMNQFRQIGRGRIAGGTIRGLLQRGKYQEANALLMDPAVGGTLDADTSRGLAMDIAVDGAKNEQLAKDRQNQVTQWTTVLRRNLTPTEIARVEALPLDKSKYSLADKISELELVQGSPASSQQISDLMNTTPTFGNSLQGRALSFVTDNAVAYANGMLSPDQARQFEASFTEAYKPVEKQDPETGLWTRIAPAVPGFAQQAFNKGQSFYRSGAAMPRPAPSNAQAPTVVGAVTTPAPAAQGGRQGAAPAPMTADNQPAAPAPSAVASTQPTVSAQANSGSIWSRRANITGPVAAAASAVGRIPGVGDAIGGGGQYTVDRQYAEATTRELIRALSQSGRYLASEMQSIEKEVSISGEVLDNPTAYGQRLIGIDEALAKRAEDAKKDLSNPSISIDKRKAANDVIATITNFRATLGVPRRVKSVEEARKLPPGSEFIDPNGVVRMVPGR